MSLFWVLGNMQFPSAPTYLLAVLIACLEVPNAGDQTALLSRLPPEERLEQGAEAHPQAPLRYREEAGRL